MTMKICVICHSFNKDNLRLQPWRYIYEIFIRLQKKGNEVIIISNNAGNETDIKKINDLSIYNIHLIPGTKNSNLLTLLQEISPDLIFWSIGYSSVFYYRTLKSINVPLIGLWMGTRYSLTQLIKIGPWEFLKNFRYLILFVVNTLVPNFIMRFFIKKISFSKFIVMTENNKKNLSLLGISDQNIEIIPPGIDKFDLEVPELHRIEMVKHKYSITGNELIILYFGSPLSLRGIDNLLQCVKELQSKINIKLVILSRRRNNNLIFEEQAIQNIANELIANGSVKIISGFLTKSEVKEFIFLSDIVVLPFKIIQADMPISILESMAMGKPVISTNIGGIEDLLTENRGYLIDQNSSECLYHAIHSLCSEKNKRMLIGENARISMCNYPLWDEIADRFELIVHKYEMNKDRK
jgi:phosphatidyl-myo-inositol dimannoside synthase